MNISEGGIALICKENNIQLEEGAIYPNCRIELPEIGTLLTTIQVKSLFQITLPNGIVPTNQQSPPAEENASRLHEDEADTHYLGQFIPLHYHHNMLKDENRMSNFKEAID